MCLNSVMLLGMQVLWGTHPASPIIVQTKKFWPALWIAISTRGKFLDAPSRAQHGHSLDRYRANKPRDKSLGLVRCSKEGSDALGLSSMKKFSL